MDDLQQEQFTKALLGLVDLAKSKKNVLEYSEINDAFRGLELSEDKLDLVLEYLEKWWKMTYLEFAGKNSLIIMATHGTLGFKVLVIKGWKAIYTLSETAGPRYYLECTGILAELMLIECGVVSIINQYFPWLTGRFKKKS